MHRAGGDLSRLFLATNIREADLVERLLDAAGIEYTQKLEPVMHETSNVCYQGTLFEVREDQADAGRRLLKENGLMARDSY
jgi:hypothetical protein